MPWNHRIEPALHPVAIIDLRPTQMTVGLREVAEKRRLWRERAERDGPEFLGRHMIPVLKGPKGAMRDEFQRLLRDIRAGKSRATSMRDMAERLNEAPISHFVTAVIQAEKMGMNLGPVLRAQAEQRRVERFHRAEKLAMEAPVKMLLPLIAFIFPCTFIVLFFPIAMQFMHSGL